MEEKTSGGHDSPLPAARPTHSHSQTISSVFADLAHVNFVVIHRQMNRHAHWDLVCGDSALYIGQTWGWIAVHDPQEYAFLLSCCDGPTIRVFKAAAYSK